MSKATAGAMSSFLFMAVGPGGARRFGVRAARNRPALAETLRRELEQTRADMNAERDALRAAHEAQIDQIQRSADQRADALNQAIQALQSQPAPRTRAPRKSRPDTQT